MGEWRIALDAPVKVEVTYLFHCAVPVVRTLICGSLDDANEQLQSAWQNARLRGSGGTLSTLLISTQRSPSDELARLTPNGSRFAVLRGEATMPNQGAPYARERDS